MWKDSVVFRKDVIDFLQEPHIENMKRLYALHYIFHGCHLVKNYEVPKQFNRLCISDFGIKVLCAVDPENIYSDAVRSVACLIVFCHQEFLISFDGNELGALIDAVSDDLKAGNIFLPERFGRVLYDRFNDRADGSRVDHLQPENVDELIVGSAQGIYQIGRIVTGPLGIIESEQDRFVPPSIRIPLWHCADTGCQHRHAVEMLKHDNPMYELANAISRYLQTEIGNASEWEHPVEMLYRKKKKVVVNAITICYH